MRSATLRRLASRSCHPLEGKRFPLQTSPTSLRVFEIPRLQIMGGLCFLGRRGAWEGEGVERGRVRAWSVQGGVAGHKLRASVLLSFASWLRFAFCALLALREMLLDRRPQARSRRRRSKAAREDRGGLEAFSQSKKISLSLYAPQTPENGASILELSAYGIVIVSRRPARLRGENDASCCKLSACTNVSKCNQVARTVRGGRAGAAARALGPSSRPRR